MDEFVLSFFSEWEGMLSVGSFGEGKGFFFGRLELSEAMESIVTEKTSINLVDIRVSACTIGFIVDNFTLNWDCSVGLHGLKLLFG